MASAALQGAIKIAVGTAIQQMSGTVENAVGTAIQQMSGTIAQAIERALTSSRPNSDGPMDAQKRGDLVEKLVKRTSPFTGEGFQDWRFRAEVSMRASLSKAE